MEPILKSHIYKMWSQAGVYLGVLDDVASEFNLALEINTAGPSPITIKLGRSGDTKINPVQVITTEDGSLITTEDGTLITTEGDPDNFGVANSQIRNGNIIEITEISTYYPNGKLVYKGRVENWDMNINTTDDALLYLTPLSTDLNDHIVKGVEVVAFDLNTYNNVRPIYNAGNPGRIALGYQLPVNFVSVNNISSIALRLRARNALDPSTVTVSLIQFSSATPNNVPDLTYPLDAPSALLGQASVVVTSTAADEYIFTFPVPIAVNTANNFTSIKIEATGGNASGVDVSWQSSDTYGGTYLWQFNDPSLPPERWGSYDGTISALFTDLRIKFFTIPDYTRIVINSFEPTIPLKKFLGIYRGEGGVVTYTDSSVQSTGVTVPSYTFSVNTIAEGLDAMLDLSPKGTYYTVDPGSYLLTFRKISTTADYSLVYRNHFQSATVSASIKNVKNATFFTGGKIGATNLFQYLQDSQSIASVGTIRIERLTDNRVTNSGTGTNLMSNFLAKNSSEVFTINVSVVDTTMDITLFKPGDTVRLVGTGNSLVEGLILPIVRLTRMRDTADLTLGVIAPRESQAFKEMQDKLLSIQTVDNPNQPS